MVAVQVTAANVDMVTVLLIGPTLTAAVEMVATEATTTLPLLIPPVEC